MPVSFCVINCTDRFTIASGIIFFRFPESEPKRTAWINAYSREGVDAVRVFANLHCSLLHSFIVIFLGLFCPRGKGALRLSLLGYEANNYVSRIVISERLKQP